MKTTTKFTTSVGIKEKPTVNLNVNVGIIGEKGMNVKNNKRRRQSQEKIEKAFIELLQTRELNDITVSDLIKQTGLNRSTFYANYIDIFETFSFCIGKPFIKVLTPALHHINRIHLLMNGF